MFVLADMEWMTNENGHYSPTQLAAVKVDENWNIVDKFEAFIRPRDTAFHDWEHVAYTGGTATDFLHARKGYNVFTTFNEWLSEDDIILWWYLESECLYKKLIQIIAKITDNHKMVSINRYVAEYLAGQLNSRGNVYRVAEGQGITVDDALKHNSANDVKVIDIAQLDPSIQGFVFGDVIQQVVERMSAKDKDTPDKIVIFVDELNKYASTDVPKSSPILRHLLDVAERGRALGIILFSVEQFRSAIHDRVKGNCANSAYGRTNFVEVTKPDYQFFGNIYKNMMTRLAPGDYIISNPALRSLVSIKFPYPTFKSNN